METFGDEALIERLREVAAELTRVSSAAARSFAIESVAMVAHLVGDEQEQFEELLEELRRAETLPEEGRPVARAAVKAAIGPRGNRPWGNDRDLAWQALRAACGEGKDAAFDAAYVAAKAATRWDSSDSGWEAELHRAAARAEALLGQ